MITITDIAAKKILEIAESSEEIDLSTGGLRIAVRGGGCAGLEYNLSIEKEKTDKDLTFTEKGINVYIDKKSALYLQGLVIDYKDTLMESGFKLENPNAQTTCGCGKSFK